MHCKETIIITGGSSGIGNATKKLLEEGDYNVLSLSRSNGFDLSDIYSVTKLESIRNQKIVALINNAAACIKKPLEEYKLEDFQTTINLNLLTPFLLTQTFLPELKKTKGTIINVSSIHAVSTIENNGIYAATKAGLESLTRSMAIEFAKYGIRVNCVRPGATMTPMLPYEKGMEKTIPLNRVAEPVEVAKVIRFLLSKESSYVTGECITVDGGVLSKLAVMK